MKTYLDLCERILTEGIKKEDRTGTGTLSVFGHQMRFSLNAGFPLVTTKKLHTRSIIYELLWFLQGNTNIQYLQIKRNPDSRRLIISAWNPPELADMALPPCHCLFQFYVAQGKLSCQLYQRSADVFLGLPFNIASYALLTHMVAHVTGLEPGEFIHTLGDAHLYVNHIEQVQEQLTRTSYPLPTLRLNPDIQSLFDFRFADIEIVNYQAHPHIKGSVAV